MGSYHGGVSGIIVGVQEVESAREGVAILLNDVWHSAVIDFGCVSSRILWIKCSNVQVCVVVGYGPNEGDGEEMDRFCNDTNIVLDRVGNVNRLYILEDLIG